MKGIKAFVLSFVALAEVSVYAATPSRSQAGPQVGSSCCVYTTRLEPSEILDCLRRLAKDE